jgi:omega-amidase
MHLILAFDTAALDQIDPPADAVVFPELVIGGYTALKGGHGIRKISDPEIQTFRHFSRTFHTTCIAGSIALENPRGKPTNTSLVFRNGRQIFRYDKIHLFRPGGDDRYFRPGSGFGVFSAGPSKDKLRAGVIICYDLRFPELTRFLARKGADILFVPARWPEVRDDAWQTLLKARAIENQMFVVGCNARDAEGGQSYVFGPGGELVFTTRTEQARQFYRVTIDTARIAEVRSRLTYAEDAAVLRALAVPRRFRRQ